METLVVFSSLDSRKLISPSRSLYAHRFKFTKKKKKEKMIPHVVLYSSYCHPQGPCWPYLQALAWRQLLSNTIKWILGTKHVALTSKRWGNVDSFHWLELV